MCTNVWRMRVSEQPVQPEFAIYILRGGEREQNAMAIQDTEGAINILNKHYNSLWYCVLFVTIIITGGNWGVFLVRLICDKQPFLCVQKTQKLWGKIGADQIIDFAVLIYWSNILSFKSLWKWSSRMADKRQESQNDDGLFVCFFI